MSDPRLDARRLLPEGHEARVLEPSPPAVGPPEFADDPTARGDANGVVVSPAPDGDETWDEFVADHPQHAAFARERWLGSLKRLGPLPESFATTRDALHQVAFFAVAPARYAATGKMGLRWTRGGFGTPFFGDDRQIRVVGAHLVTDGPDGFVEERISTVRNAVEFLGHSYREVWFDDFHDPLEPIGADADLDVDPIATAALADWFGFATHVLEILRREPGAVDVSRVQLWPEHFDPAIELGSADAGRRASYGASPGDAGIAEPYLYVSPWAEVDSSDPFFDAPTFTGGVLRYSQLLAAHDQRDAALAFYRAGRSVLGA